MPSNSQNWTFRQHRFSKAMITAKSNVVETFHEFLWPYFFPQAIEQPAEILLTVKKPFGQ